MHCPRCQHENREHATFCAQCAASLQPTCPQCGTDLPAVAQFCDKCAAPVSMSLATSAAPDEEAPTLPNTVKKRGCLGIVASTGTLIVSLAYVVVSWIEEHEQHGHGRRLDDPAHVLSLLVVVVSGFWTWRALTRRRRHLSQNFATAGRSVPH